MGPLNFPIQFLPAYFFALWGLSRACFIFCDTVIKYHVYDDIDEKQTKNNINSKNLFYSGAISETPFSLPYLM